MITKNEESTSLINQKEVNGFVLELTRREWGFHGMQRGENFHFSVWNDDNLCDYSLFHDYSSAENYFNKKVLLFSKEKILQRGLFLRPFGTSGRLEEECIPNSLLKDKTYPFLKRDLRNFLMHKTVHLGITDGTNKIFDIAKISITAVSYDSQVDIGEYTFGKYKILEVYRGNKN